MNLFVIIGLVLVAFIASTYAYLEFVARKAKDDKAIRGTISHYLGMSILLMALYGITHQAIDLLAWANAGIDIIVGIMLVGASVISVKGARSHVKLERVLSRI